jgi:phage shock protein PspC (stress-responsive transcriptional regulator)
MLGWALTAFGIFQAFGVLNICWTASLAGRMTDYNGDLSAAAQVVLPQVLSGLAICVISLIAGVVVRGREVDPKVVGLLFVFGALVSFPVGTILSAYVLAYLFIIRVREREAPDE